MIRSLANVLVCSAVGVVVLALALVVAGVDQFTELGASHSPDEKDV